MIKESSEVIHDGSADPYKEGKEALDQSNESQWPTSVLCVYRGHKDMVSVLAWSPDGRLLASGSNDKDIQVWDPMTEHRVCTYDGHSSGRLGSVRALSWSPDGKQIASGDSHGSLHVWRVSSGKQIFTRTIVPTSALGRDILAVAWSADGKRVTTENVDGTLHIWNARSGSLIATSEALHFKPLVGSAYSPDGSLFAARGDHDTRHVQVWNLQTAATIFLYRGHTQLIWGLDWSPDGKRIASGSEDKTVQVWDATTGEHVFVYRGHEGTILTVAYSPEGTRIASGGEDTTVQVWREW